MRSKIIPPLLFVVLSYTWLGTAERTVGQTPAPKKPGLKIDPGLVFDQWMSKGRGFFLISEVQRDRVDLEKFATQEGIQNGKVTRAQFIKYWNQRAQQRQQAERQRVELAKREAALEAAATQAFHDLDLNRDGFLNSDEIKLAKEFRTEWRQWDSDGDDLISLTEWKVYWRQQQLHGSKLAQKNTDQAKPPLVEVAPKTSVKPLVKGDTKPMVPPQVKRTGKLPPNLPVWFKQIDLDGDGQVSLFEWQKAGKDIEEFIKLDLNDDGFLTVEEVLRSQQVYILPKTEKKKPKQPKDD